MIVASYNSSDDHGGAAKAAFRLNAALREAGVEAFLLCEHKRTRSEYSIRLIQRRSESSKKIAQFQRFWSQSASHFLVTENRTGLSSTIFTIDPFGLDVTEAPLSSVARVHHLHWCRGFITPAAIGAIRATEKPLFMTLHDQWWMTGGCHYTAGCDRFENACDHCPQLLSDPADIVPAALAEKISVYGDGDVTVITPSQWMADCARRSTVFRNADIHVVRNPIDVNIFAPLLPDARAEARAEIGLEEGEIGILFGAQTLTDRRKGFSELIEALKQVKVHGDKRLCLVSFGRSAKNALSSVNIPTIDLGEISNDKRLAEVYAAADLFVVPSLEDNYPNTIVESLACGTPVVGFAAGGISDLVDGTRTGLLAKPVGDVGELADAISAGIDRFAGNDAARDACREAVEQTHDPMNIAAKMLDLYADKNPRFHEPLSDIEAAIVRMSIKRNRTGKPTFARLNTDSTIFDSEEALRILLPLSSVHALAEVRHEAGLRGADLTVRPREHRRVGRGLSGVRCLGKGWAQPYRNGAWSAKPQAHMHFFLDTGEIINSVRLQLSGVNNKNQEVAVYQDDVKRTVLEVEGKQTHNFTVPLSPVTGPRYFNLTLKFPTIGAGGQQSETKPQRVFLSSFDVQFEEPDLRLVDRIGQRIHRLFPPSVRPDRSLSK